MPTHYSLVSGYSGGPRANTITNLVTRTPVVYMLRDSGAFTPHLRFRSEHPSPSSDAIKTSELMIHVYLFTCPSSSLHQHVQGRAGVKYVLSNTNTNTNTKIWIFQIQIQIFSSTLIQIQIQIQIHPFKYKYKYVQPNISAETVQDPK